MAHNIALGLPAVGLKAQLLKWDAKHPIGSRLVGPLGLQEVSVSLGTSLDLGRASQDLPGAVADALGGSWEVQVKRAPGSSARATMGGVGSVMVSGVSGYVAAATGGQPSGEIRANVATGMNLVTAWAGAYNRLAKQGQVEPKVSFALSGRTPLRNGAEFVNGFAQSVRTQAFDRTPGIDWGQALLDGGSAVASRRARDPLNGLSASVGVDLAAKPKLLGQQIGIGIKTTYNFSKGDASASLSFKVKLPIASAVPQVKALLSALGTGAEASLSFKVGLERRQGLGTLQFGDTVVALPTGLGTVVNGLVGVLLPGRPGQADAPSLNSSGSGMKVVNFGQFFSGLSSAVSRLLTTGRLAVDQDGGLQLALSGGDRAAIASARSGTGGGLIAGDLTASDLLLLADAGLVDTRTGAVRLDAAIGVPAAQLASLDQASQEALLRAYGESLGDIARAGDLAADEILEGSGIDPDTLAALAAEIEAGEITVEDLEQAGREALGLDFALASAVNDLEFLEEALGLDPLFADFGDLQDFDGGSMTLGEGIDLNDTGGQVIDPALYTEADTYEFDSNVVITPIITGSGFDGGSMTLGEGIDLNDTGGQVIDQALYTEAGSYEFSDQVTITPMTDDEIADSIDFATGLEATIGTSSDAFGGGGLLTTANGSSDPTIGVTTSELNFDPMAGSVVGAAAGAVGGGSGIGGALPDLSGPIGIVNSSIDINAGNNLGGFAPADAFLNAPNYSIYQHATIPTWGSN